MTNIECIAVNHTYDNCLPQTHDSHIVVKLNLVRNRNGVVCPCFSIKETCGLNFEQSIVTVRHLNNAVNVTADVRVTCHRIHVRIGNDFLIGMLYMIPQPDILLGHMPPCGNEVDILTVRLLFRDGVGSDFVIIQIQIGLVMVFTKHRAAIRTADIKTAMSQPLFLCCRHFIVHKRCGVHKNIGAGIVQRVKKINCTLRCGIDDLGFQRIQIRRSSFPIPNALTMCATAFTGSVKTHCCFLLSIKNPVQLFLLNGVN